MIIVLNKVKEIIMSTQVIKVTVSVPADLVKLADMVAKEKKISRSKVVSSCLQELANQRSQAEMEEGYRAMAADEQREKDALEWAEASIENFENAKR
jgi:metal-responsive CopG/Arc/MetJ family transcriptional regulator